MPCGLFSELFGCAAVFSIRIGLMDVIDFYYTGVMLENEFKKLIGRDCSFHEYTVANSVYMETDLDKEDFCKEWDRIKDSRVVYELMSRISGYSRKLELVKNNTRFISKLFEIESEEFKRVVIS